MAGSRFSSRQRAMIAALGDESHVGAQKAVYRARREVLLEAVRAYGFEVSDSEAGLYLWATLGEDCWATMNPPEYKVERKDIKIIDPSERPTNREYDHYLIDIFFIS